MKTSFIYRKRLYIVELLGNGMDVLVSYKGMKKLIPNSKHLYFFANSFSSKLESKTRQEVHALFI